MLHTSSPALPEHPAGEGGGVDGEHLVHTRVVTGEVQVQVLPHVLLQILKAF